MLSKISDIEVDEVVRIRSGFYGFDLILGDDSYGGSGFVLGAMSVLSGEGGTGKTRLISSISKDLNDRKKTVLIFQSETTLSQFKRGVPNLKYPDNYYVSSDLEIQAIIEQIDLVKPDFVAIDSINMLDGFSSEPHLKDTIQSLRDSAQRNNCHILLIAQQNASGKLKGLTTLPHLVDVVIYARKDIKGFDDKIEKCNNSFFAIIEKKNRYGQVNGWARFKHTSEGVIDGEAFYCPSATLDINKSQYDRKVNSKVIETYQKYNKNIEKDTNWVADGLTNLAIKFGVKK